MIDSRELRVGNWVMNGDNPHQWSIYDYTLNQEFYSPIPLTPEILVACGFEYEDMGDDSPYERWVCKEYKELWVWDFNGEEWLFCLGDAFEQGGFHYLHQLQNIHFSLTQTEITYQPNQTKDNE